MSVWEERWHPLREEWVIVAAHRQNRPWIGETVASKREVTPAYLPDCYLCPGNARVSGRINDAYDRTFVFDNDHPCVGDDAPEIAGSPAGVFRSRSARGIARVVCYSPRHDLTLAELPVGDVAHLLEVWQQQYRDLGDRPGIDHVLIFENKGEVVGVSNPHPHCQIYATNFVFKFIETEARASARHFAETGRRSSRTFSMRSVAPGGAFSSRTRPPSPSSPTSPVTPTRCTSPRKRRARASQPCRRPRWRTSQRPFRGSS
jgi:UDPglucose--hexose-1-phosphate uridylyltransferase